MTKFICKNVGFSTGKFCIMPQKSWPPPSFRVSGRGLRPRKGTNPPGQLSLGETTEPHLGPETQKSRMLQSPGAHIWPKGRSVEVGACFRSRLLCKPGCSLCPPVFFNAVSKTTTCAHLAQHYHCRSEHYVRP